MVALREACRDLQRVRALILVSPYVAPRARSGLPSQLLLRVPGLGRELVHRHGRPKLEAMLRDACSPHPVPAAARDWAARLDTAELHQGVLEKWRPAVSFESAAASVRAVGVPVALIRGAADRTSGPHQLEDVRQALAPCFDARLSGAGHAIPWTHPEALAAALRRFLGGLGTSPALWSWS
jgi:pimeloyl-ACP methyl ester carboxylesterase